MKLFWILIVAAAALVPARAQQWQPVPLVTAQMRRAGVAPGGEGAQAIRTVAISASEPSFLLAGTDVGGIYRTRDGGAHWQVCMSGWNARGGNFFAIDPHRSTRILGTGANSSDLSDADGVYLSTDQGAHWKEVLPAKSGNDRRDALAFDPASYDPKRGFCTVAYYDGRDDGLYKSADGGATWTLLSKDYRGCIVKVHPSKGYVYLASNSNPQFGTPCGFYKSTDGGKTFALKLAGYTLGMDVVSSRPADIYLARWDKVQLSTDGGESFHSIGRDWSHDGLPTGTPIQDIRVSPADPQVMACRYGGPQWWQAYALYSHDGGSTWHPVAYDNAQAFLPFTQPDEHCAFHPTNPKLVYSACAGGWLTKSTDGGARYRWASNGENAVMVGGSFFFPPRAPRAAFFSFQDYNGALTTDGGCTWTYQNPSGQSWGGFEYGGGTLDGRVLWSGDAPSWGGPRTLKVSRDGGRAWAVATDALGKAIVFAGSDISAVDPAAPAVCFASNWRSTDAGRTWGVMPGCDGVFAASGTALYGRHGAAVCRSTNHGAAWADITPPVPGGLHDLAFDPNAGRFYAASEGTLKVLRAGAWVALPTPKDQYGQTHLRTVAVDPVHPNIVYAGGAADLYATSVACIRSLDGGRTWANLSVTAPLAWGRAGGPHEVQWVRVHPATRAAWVSGECYGLWKIAPPALRAPSTSASAAPVRERAKGRGASSSISHARNCAWCSRW